jgi:hypothetical protein
VIAVTCPACGHHLALLVVDSSGWCICGADYVIESAKHQITFTPDPHYPTALKQPVTLNLQEAS